MNERIKKKLMEFEPLPIRDPAGKHVRKLKEAQELLHEIAQDVQSSEDSEECHFLNIM